jgi:hypothetical protein
MQWLRIHFGVREMMDQVAIVARLQWLLDPIRRFHWNEQRVHSQDDRLYQHRRTVSYRLLHLAFEHVRDTWVWDNCGKRPYQSLNHSPRPSGLLVFYSLVRQRSLLPFQV